MENKVFMSIVIPMYDAEEYILQCLTSINNQTDKDFEIIIVDDGSKDKSSYIAKQYLENSKLLYKIIKQENQGQSIARNIGLSNSSGEYILFLDSDDFIEKNLVEKVKESSISKTSDIILFDYRRIKENQTIVNAKKQDFDNTKQSGIDLIYEYRNNNFRLWTSCIVYNRGFVKKNNLKYLECCYGAEDLNFIFKSLMLAKEMYYIDEVLSYYYQRSTSLTNKPDINKNITVIDSLKNVSDFAKEKSLDSKLEKIIEKEFIPEHIMYQIFKATNQNNKLEIIQLLKSNKVKSCLKRAKCNTPRYGKSFFIWIKLATYNPSLFTKIYLKRKN